jgi:hypothetical protein
MNAKLIRTVPKPRVVVAVDLGRLVHLERRPGPVRSTIWIREPSPFEMGREQPRLRMGIPGEK